MTPAEFTRELEAIREKYADKIRGAKDRAQQIERALKQLAAATGLSEESIAAEKYYGQWWRGPQPRDAMGSVSKEYWDEICPLIRRFFEDLG